AGGAAPGDQCPGEAAAGSAAAAGQPCLRRAAGAGQAAHVPAQPDLLCDHRAHIAGRAGRRGAGECIALVQARLVLRRAGGRKARPVTSEVAAAHRAGREPPLGPPPPVLYSLACPRAGQAVSRLEASGTMREMTARLAADANLREAYRAAHQDYLSRRQDVARAAGAEPLPPAAGSAGGMPDRVKCLHALVAHELAVPGSNPLGRQAMLAAGPWWQPGPCVAASA